VAIRPEEALRQLPLNSLCARIVAFLTRRAQMNSWRGPSLKKKVSVAYRMSRLWPERGHPKADGVDAAAT
jgi:hypothetical protein